MSDQIDSRNSTRVPDLDIKLSDGSNYPEWAEMLTVYLALHNLGGIIDGTITNPANTPTDTKASEKAPVSDIKRTIANDHQKWQRANSQARAFMIANTTGNARSCILMERDAHTAWEALRAQYEGKTRTNLMALLQGVVNLRFDHKKFTIDEHIGEFETRWARFASTVAGTTDPTTPEGVYALMTKNDIVKGHMLLGTLSDRYKLLVSNIMSQAETPPYRSITVQLRDLITDDRDDDTPTLPPTAFTANTTRPERVCNYCKGLGFSGRGHLETDCRTKRRIMEATESHRANFVENNRVQELSEWAF